MIISEKVAKSDMVNILLLNDSGLILYYLSYL
jgi:hypothetical protein